MNKKTIFTFRNALLLLLLPCLIFVFCTSFRISFLWEKMNISVLNAITGITKYGQSAFSSRPSMAFSILLPIAEAVILFVNKISDKWKAFIVSACTLADLVCWVLFGITVKVYAVAQHCSMETSASYAVCVIILCVLLIAECFMLFSKKSFKNELSFLWGVKTSANGSDTATPAEKMSTVKDTIIKGAAVLSGASEKIIDRLTEEKTRHCPECGKLLSADAVVCENCGAQVPENFCETPDEQKTIVLADETVTAPETSGKSADEADRIFCPYCGKKIGPASAFCSYCGSRIG